MIAQLLKKLKPVVVWLKISMFIGVPIVAIQSTFEARGSSLLLRKIALVKPGVKLDSLRPQLGRQVRVFEKKEELLLYGSVKNESFCEGKKLFVFLVVIMPYRTLDIYTDKGNNVVYVTWQRV